MEPESDPVALVSMLVSNSEDLASTYIAYLGDNAARGGWWLLRRDRGSHSGSGSWRSWLLNAWGRSVGSWWSGLDRGVDGGRHNWDAHGRWALDWVGSATHGDGGSAWAVGGVNRADLRGDVGSLWLRVGGHWLGHVLGVGDRGWLRDVGGRSADGVGSSSWAHGGQGGSLLSSGVLSHWLGDLGGRSDIDSSSLSGRTFLRCMGSW